jgi:hypothetical protein
MQTPRVLDETFFRCSQSRRHFDVSPQTIDNWRRIGIVCRETGERITLEWAYFGKSPVTSMEAFKRFHQRVNNTHLLRAECNKPDT